MILTLSCNNLIIQIYVSYTILILFQAYVNSGDGKLGRNVQRDKYLLLVFHKRLCLSVVIHWLIPLSATDIEKLNPVKMH